MWEDNPNAAVQYAHIKTNKGMIEEGLEVSPKLFAEVFCLPMVQTHKLRKVSDAVMKVEFGVAEDSRSYYMISNCPKLRATHLGWYLDKVCVLAKLIYMSKEAFAPLYYAERGVKIDWATWMFERCQLGEGNRRLPSYEKLAPYLSVLFAYKSRMDALEVSPLNRVKGPEVGGKLEFKKQKTEADSYLEDVVKSAAKSSVLKRHDPWPSGRSKDIFNPDYFGKSQEVVQSDSKTRRVEILPGRLSAGVSEEKVSYHSSRPSISSQSPLRKSLGVCSAQEAVQRLSELVTFVNNQEAMITTLEAQKTFNEELEVQKWEIARLTRVLELERKEKWQRCCGVKRR